MAPTIQKSYAKTLKNQTTMNDINKKLKQIELQLERNKLEITILKRENQNYIKIEEVYEIIYQVFWGSINQGFDTLVELKFCLKSTIKDRLSYFSSNINKN